MNSLILLLAMTPGAISVDEMGAKGDGVTNDAPAIQAAIDRALSTQPQPNEFRNGYNRGGTIMFSDHKRYRCESPLVIAGPSQVLDITLAGETPSYAAGGCATLFFPYTDRPGIVLQTVRDVHIRNLALIGANDFNSKLNSPEDYVQDENYIVGTVRTNRYSPYCGISIDSFDNAVAAGDRYPGMAQWYHRDPIGGSKQVHIENCTIMGWYVGIMVNSANGSQGDGIFIDHNTISTCTYAVAIGQTQSRGIDIRDNEFGNHKVVFDTISFGQRKGTPPHVQGGLIDGVKYLFLCGTAVGNLHVSDVYSEVICSLGVINGGAHPNATPALFTGCQFNFEKTQRQPEAQLISGGNVKFEGCGISSLGKCLNFQTLTGNNCDSPSVEFDNCDLGTVAENAETSIYVNAFTHARWRNAAVFDSYWSTHISTGERHPLTDRRQVGALSNVSMKIVAPGEVIMTPAETHYVEFAENVIPIGTGHGIKFLGGGGATLRLPDPALFKVGDIVRGSATNASFDLSVQGSTVINIVMPKVGVISSIEGNTANLIEVPCSFDDGHVKFAALEVASMKRFHLPTTGTLTSGSNQITDCAVSPNTNLGGAWFVGNRIYGIGIPSGAYVTNISGSTITLSKAATQTNTNVTLYDARYKSQ